MAKTTRTNTDARANTETKSGVQLPPAKPADTGKQTDTGKPVHGTYDGYTYVPYRRDDIGVPSKARVYVALLRFIAKHGVKPTTDADFDAIATAARHTVKPSQPRRWCRNWMANPPRGTIPRDIKLTGCAVNLTAAKPDKRSVSAALRKWDGESAARRERAAAKSTTETKSK